MESRYLPVCLELISLIHSVRNRLSVIAESYGMTGVQLGALHTISEREVTMGKVAQILHCDASNATGIVDRLVALGLVARRESEHDRRSKILTVTDKGRLTIERARAEMPERLGCAKLSEAECRAIHSLALKMAVDA